MTKSSWAGFVDITAAYHNTTAKPIDGLKLSYVCSNNFGDKVDQGKFEDQNKALAGNAAGTFKDKVFAESCTKATVRVDAVHFADGTAWP